MSRISEYRSTKPKENRRERESAASPAEDIVDWFFDVAENPEIVSAVTSGQDGERHVESALEEICAGLDGGNSVQQIWCRGAAVHALGSLLETCEDMRAKVSRRIDVVESLAIIVRDCDVAIKNCRGQLCAEATLFQKVKLNACYALSRIQHRGDTLVRFDKSLLLMNRNRPTDDIAKTNDRVVKRKGESKYISSRTLDGSKSRKGVQVHSLPSRQRIRNGVTRSVAHQIVAKELATPKNIDHYTKYATQTDCRRDPDTSRRVAVFSAKQHVSVEVTDAILALQNLSDAAKLHESLVRKQMKVQMSRAVKRKYSTRAVFEPPNDSQVESLRPGIGIELPECLLAPQDEEQLKLRPLLHSISIEVNDGEKKRKEDEHRKVSRSQPLPPIATSKIRRLRDEDCAVSQYVLPPAKSSHVVAATDGGGHDFVPRTRRQSAATLPRGANSYTSSRGARHDATRRTSRRHANGTSIEYGNRLTTTAKKERHVGLDLDLGYSTSKVFVPRHSSSFLPNLSISPRELDSTARTQSFSASLVEKNASTKRRAANLSIRAATSSKGSRSDRIVTLLQKAASTGGQLEWSLDGPSIDGVKDDVAESWVRQRTRNEYEARVLAKLQSVQMHAALDSLPLSFLLREISELTFSRVCGLHYIRRRLRRALEPLWRYLNQTALRARFLRWWRTVKTVAELERHAVYSKKMAVKRMDQLMRRLLLKIRVHRQRRAIQKWRAFKEFVAWKKEEAALIQLQARMRGVVSRILLKRHLLRVRMAIRIQAITRMRPAIEMLKRARRAAIAVQKHVRMIQAFRFYQIQRASIFKMQASWLRFFYWRRYMRTRWAATIVVRNVRWWRVERTVARRAKARLVRLEVMFAAACKIQRIWRGHRGRVLTARVLALKRANFKRYFDAALSIQRVWYRANGFSGRFALCCALRVKHEEEERTRRREILLLRLHIATKLQSIFRAKLARSRTRSIRRKRDAAAEIQKTWRGYVLYRRFQKLIRRLRASKTIQRWIRAATHARNMAAVTIQHWYWRILVRRCRRVALLRWRRWDMEVWALVEDAVRIRDAANVIQRFLRCRWSQRVYARLKSGKKIVSAARGYFGRRRVRRIHRYVRHKVTRKYVRKLLQRAIPKVLPKIWWQRRRAIDVLTRSLRKFVRKWKLRRRQQETAKMHDAATRLQNRWRARSGVLRYSNMLRMKSISERNAFEACVDIGAVLNELSRKVNRIYDPLDPLVGISLASFLHRIGSLCLYGTLSDRTRGANTIITVEDLVKFCEPPIESKKMLQSISTRRRERARGEVVETVVTRMTRVFDLSDESKPACVRIAKLLALGDPEALSNVRTYASRQDAYECCLQRFPRSETRATNFAKAIVVLEGTQRVSKMALRATVSSVRSGQELRDSLKKPGVLIAWDSVHQEMVELLLSRLRRERFQHLAEQAVYKIVQLFRPVKSKKKNDAPDMRHIFEMRVVKAMRLALSRVPSRLAANPKSLSLHSASDRAICDALRNSNTTQGYRAERLCVVALNGIVADLRRMDNAARCLQGVARCRLAKIAIIHARASKKRAKVMQAYKVERQSKVRKAFSNELEEQRKQQIMWKMSEIPKFGWSKRVDIENSSAYYLNVETGRSQWECPSYSIREYDSAQKLIVFSRGYLGRLRVWKIRRSIELEKRRKEEIKQWASKAVRRMKPCVMSTSVLAAKSVMLLRQSDQQNGKDAANDESGDSTSAGENMPHSSARRPGSSSSCAQISLSDSVRPSTSRPWSKRPTTSRTDLFRRTYHRGVNLKSSWTFRRRTRQHYLIKDRSIFGNDVIGRYLTLYEKPSWYKPVERRWVRRLASNIFTRAFRKMWVKVDAIANERRIFEQKEQDTALEKRISYAEFGAGLELVGFGIHATKYMRWVRVNAKDWASRNARDDAKDPQVKRFTTFMRMSVDECERALAQSKTLRAMLCEQKESRKPWWEKQSSNQRISAKSASVHKKKNTQTKPPSAKRTKNSMYDDRSLVMSISLAGAEKIGKRKGRLSKDTTKMTSKRKGKSRRRKKAASDSPELTCRLLAEHIFAESVHRAIEYIDAQHKAVVSLVKEIAVNAVDVAQRRETKRLNDLDSKELSLGWFLGRVVAYDDDTKRHLLEIRPQDVGNNKERSNIICRDDTRRRLVWRRLDEGTRWIGPQTMQTCALVISLKVTWLCRFGWECFRDENLDAYYYWNRFTGKSTYEHPDYTFDEMKACALIQRSYRAHAGRKFFLHAIRHCGAFTLLKTTVKRASEIAWIGYGMEGVDTAMWLARIGLPEVIANLSPKSNVRKMLGLKKRTVLLSELKAMNKSNLDLLGIRDPIVVTQIRRIATSKEAESRAMALVVSERESNRFCALDEKVWIEKIADRAGPLPLFRKMFPNQTIRCRSFVTDVLNSKPIMSLGALEFHLSQCVNKPRLAQDGVRQKYANAKFSSSCQDVSRALALFVAALRRVEVLFANMHVDAMYDRARETLVAVDAILNVDSRSGKNVEAEKIPANENESLPSSSSSSSDDDSDDGDDDRVKKTDKNDAEEDKEAIESLKWERRDVEMKAALECRKCIAELCKWERMVIRLQSQFRGHKKHVVWMQYKYVRYTAARRIQTQFRILLAKRSADALRLRHNSPWEQCWDATDKVYYYFNVRTNETTWELASENTPFRPQGWWPHLSAMAESGPILALEQCQVCCERDASRICKNCETSSESNGAGKHPFRFCFKCFYETHSDAEMREHRFEACSRTVALPLVCEDSECPGRLSDAHRSHALASRYCEKCETLFCGVAACDQCERKIAERKCHDCGDAFCVSCFEGYHAHGHRRHHKWELCKERVKVGEKHCRECNFNVARKACTFCKESFCVGCFVQHELRGCLEKFPCNHPCMLGVAECIECGKPADRTCVECGESYCDQRWFGNPGCFEWFHRKGKLRKHKCKKHPRADIVRAATLIQSSFRRHRCLAKVLAARKDQAARRLQRAWQSHTLKRATWESLGLDMGVKGLLKMKMRRAKGFVKRVGRAAMGKSKVLPPRLLVRMEVLKRWKATDTRAELKRFIKEGLEEHAVASDRQAFLLKKILEDVMEEKKRKLREMEERDSKEATALERRMKKTA
eukprot:g1336.t1